MLKIDDRSFNHADLAQLIGEIRDTFTDLSAARLAVCTSDIWHWLALVFYCRDHNISIAPIHPDTPIVAAKAKAATLGCDILIWQHVTNLHLLDRSRAVPQGQAKGALIQMSSGTTGEPKVVERTWREIDEEIAAYNQTVKFPRDMAPVLVCSVTHSYGLICGVLASLARGASPHVVTSWNPKYALQILRSYTDAVLYSSPPFIYSLAQMFPSEKFPFAVMTSGSFLPESWFEFLRPRFRHFFQQYGCSEVGCITVAKNPAGADIIGRPLPHLRLELAQPIGALLPATAAELVVYCAEKSVHTQDLVFQDPGGNWHFCSRMDDTIIVSGINVYPVEVENVLARLPGVEDVVVFRKEDPLVGQRVAAVYTGARDIPLNELRTWCAQNLARHQWPSHWQHLVTIPRLANGKISRRLLATQDLSPLLWRDVANAEVPVS